MPFAIINWLQEPFQYEFMQHAFLAGSLAAILASLVGFFVVVRQLGFAAHALGHIGFAGACGAMLFGLAPIVGQLLITVFAGVTMGIWGRKLEERDTITGITLAFALGLGVLFLYFLNSSSAQANSILFGDLLGVSDVAIRWMFWLTVLGLVGLGILARPLWFSSLMPVLAEAKSLSVGWVSVLFFGILAVAITLASQVVGVLLVFALVVGPPAIALRWRRDFWSGMGLCLAVSLLVVWGAIFLSYVSDWPVSFFVCGLVFVGYGASVVFGKRV